MLLHEIVSLYSKIEKEREVMHELASYKGLTDPEVLRISQNIDDLINRYQQILKTIKTIFLTETRLIRREIMYKVSLRARGQQFEYACAENATPLRAARDQFIPIPTGCVRGGCGICKVKVLHGEYDQEIIRSHDALSDEELANNYALACCMTAKSDLDIMTVEDYEKLQRSEQNLEKISQGK